jgi:tRNA-2-methylthio-N6-dimethylallyladenosine synthase
MTVPIRPRTKEMRFLEGGGLADAPAREGSLVSPVLSSGGEGRRTFWVETYGCQMNGYDSEFIASRFLEEGWAPAPDPVGADVVLFNTCSVRQAAEDRVRSRVESFAGLKRSRPDLVLGVVGCMAQRLGDELEAGRGVVDLVAGTDTYRDLPRLVEEARGPRAPKLVATAVDAEHTYAIRRYVRPREEPIAHLTIMQGCDKFCTFCIVPFTRGRERSKPADVVVAEARRLVERGAKEIVLLGQNVNSYRDGDVGFADLLRRVSAVDGLARIHFTSSYPRDMTTEVFEAIAECGPPVEFLHFPVQSGSDRVLRRMKRRHTVEWYLRKIDEARRIIPGVHFCTDLIVGFPGETEEEFRDTLRMVERVRFSEAYMYKYSAREGTPATRLPDDLPEEEKTRRLEELIELQRRIGAEILDEQLGRRAEVLVEGPSKRNADEPFGRTRNRFMVVMPPGTGEPGDLVEVTLAERRGATLRGIPSGTGES